MIVLRAASKKNSERRISLRIRKPLAAIGGRHFVSSFPRQRGVKESQPASQPGRLIPNLTIRLTGWRLTAPFPLVKTQWSGSDGLDASNLFPTLWKWEERANRSSRSFSKRRNHFQIKYHLRFQRNSFISSLRRETATLLPFNALRYYLLPFIILRILGERNHWIFIVIYASGSCGKEKSCP